MMPNGRLTQMPATPLARRPGSPRRALVAVMLAVVLCAPGIRAARAQTPALPRIWISSPPVAGYMTLFTDPASWETGLTHVQVLKLSTFFASRVGDKGLEKIIRFTQAHHIKLALEAGMLTPGPNECGEGVEGYNPPGFMLGLARRIQKLGGRIDIIAMDEPYYFGHIATSFWRPNHGVCRASIPQVAQNAARTIAAIRTVFPNVEVGDIEPIPNYAKISAADDPRIPQLVDWAKAFAQATGRPLSFMHFDVGWITRPPLADPQTEQNGWIAALLRAVMVTRSIGLPYGIIINGRPDATSNIAWTSSAEQHFKIIEGRLGLHPSDVVFQTWVKLPNHVGPETTPGTLTSLLADYVRWRESRMVQPATTP